MKKTATSSLGNLIIISCLLWTSTAIAAKLQFKLHYIEENPSWVTSAHQVTLSDIDNDGDLDWTVGNVHKNPNLYWFEYQEPDKWIRHYIDSDPIFYGGACALDVNGDGWIDLVSSELLYVNKGSGKGWSKYNIGTSDDHCHDLQEVDMNQDGRLDIISTSDKEGVNWYQAQTDPTKPWIRHDIGDSAYRPHAATNPQSVADFDSDGDLDVAAAQAWFENLDGNGLRWKKHNHKLIGLEGPWGAAVKTVCLDLDFDGDIDIVQSECDHRGPVGVGWLENTDGKGTFKLHWIKERVEEDFHTLAVIDYDNDGDWDILTAVGPLAKVEKKTYIIENLSGQGNRPTAWREHVILSGPQCHEALTGDVDADGDIDLVLKGWTSGPFIYMENILGNKVNGQKILRRIPQFPAPSHITRGAYPDIAFGKDGCAHLVYVRNGTLRYRNRSSKDKTWSTEINTGIPQGMVNRSDPEIIVDASGHIHVLVGSTYAWLDDNRWNRIEGVFTRDTDLALNSAGDAFVVRRGGHDKGFLGLLKHSFGSSQFEALPDPDIAAGFPLGRNDHVYGSIAISPLDDSLHIVYRHATPKNISYRVSTDGGLSWKGSGITDHEPEAPDITVTKKGQVFVINADGHVFRKRKRADKWIDLGQALEGARRNLPRIEVDSNGTVHVVAFGGQYNRFSNGKWDGVRTLPSRRGRKLGYADMAIKFDGTILIAYEEGDAVQREKISGESDILIVPISE